MIEVTFIKTVFGYVAINILLFIIEKFTYKFKVMHKIMSAFDNIVFVLILGYGLYRENHLFVIFVPCILLILYPIVWGVNKELSKEERGSIVIVKSPIPLTKKQHDKIAIVFLNVGTFPFFYLLKSWGKEA